MRSDGWAVAVVVGQFLMMFMIGVMTSRIAFRGAGIKEPAMPLVESVMNFSKSVRPMSLPAINPSAMLSIVGCNSANAMAAAIMRNHRGTLRISRGMQVKRQGRMKREKPRRKIHRREYAPYTYAGICMSGML